MVAMAGRAGFRERDRDGPRLIDTGLIGGETPSQTGTETRHGLSAEVFDRGRDALGNRDRDGPATLAGDPDPLHKRERLGFVSPELGSDEGEEVVDSEIGLRHLGEVLHLVHGAVVLLHPAAVAEDAFVALVGGELLPGLLDLGVLEAEDAVVVGVGQLVQDGVGLGGLEAGGGEVGGARDVHRARHFRREAVLAQPLDARVVLRPLEILVVQVEPDLDLSKVAQAGRRELVGDGHELVCEEAEGSGAELSVRGGEEAAVDVDLPSLDVALEVRDLEEGEL
jgi:hypothetical protein